MNQERKDAIEKAKALNIEFSKRTTTKTLLKLIEDQYPELRDRQAEPENLAPRYRRPPVCPECGHKTPACSMQRKDYSLWRCRNRECRHRWEIKPPEPKEAYLKDRDGRLLYRTYGPGV